MNCQAILVNYHGAELICDAVRSLGHSPGLRVDVVDNSVADQEAEFLRTHLPPSTGLLTPERNLGFGQACNLAFAQGDSEFVLLLNPDARLLPGALETMIATLRENPRLGAVGPRVFWDESRRFLMPPSTFPSPGWYLRCRLGLSLPFLDARADRRFRQSALDAWRATRPLRVEALSGGHVLLRRSAVQKAGGLFDPAFFMYWEDSDLMLRLKRRGYQLAQDPRAEALHLYTHSPAKDRMLDDGWQVYERKHFGGPSWKWAARLARARRPGVAEPERVCAIDGETDRLVLEAPEGLAQWLLEISPAANFVPAIGCFGSGREVELPGALLRAFAGCKLYFRITGDNIGQGPCRTWALPA